MKSNRKFNPDSKHNQIQIEDDYEDFGYEVKNAKRLKAERNVLRSSEITMNSTDIKLLCDTNRSVH